MGHLVVIAYIAFHVTTIIGRKYDMLWIVIPLFIMGALAGFTNIFKMAKKIYGQDGGRNNVTKNQ